MEGWRVGRLEGGVHVFCGSSDYFSSYDNFPSELSAAGPAGAERGVYPLKLNHPDPAAAGCLEMRSGNKGCHSSDFLEYFPLSSLNPILTNTHSHSDVDDDDDCDDHVSLQPNLPPLILIQMIGIGFIFANWQMVMVMGQLKLLVFS